MVRLPGRVAHARPALSGHGRRHSQASRTAPSGIAVNIVILGGTTATGMIPDELIEAARRSLLVPEIMGPPVVSQLG